MAISKIKADGIEKFLSENSITAESNIEGIYHYNSLLADFEKFIFFDFDKSKEASLVLSEKNENLNDFLNQFPVKNSNYNFREDTSKIEIGDHTYIIIDGKVDVSHAPIISTDARGNIKSAKDIEVQAIIIEIK